MRETLLDDFVRHVERTCGIDLCQTAADLVRCPSNGCRGERFLVLAAAASNLSGEPVASLMESFGSEWARRHCGRHADDVNIFADLFAQMDTLAGNEVSVKDQCGRADRVDLVVLFHGTPGCGDVIAGLLNEWSRTRIARARLERCDFSALPGSHVRFRLTGERI